MAKKKTDEDQRETATTRLYADSLKIFKLLAELHDLTMVEYLDQVARRLAREEGPRLMEEMARLTGELSKITGVESDRRKGRSE